MRDEKVEEVRLVFFLYPTKKKSAAFSCMCQPTSWNNIANTDRSLFQAKHELLVNHTWREKNVTVMQAIAIKGCSCGSLNVTCDTTDSNFSVANKLAHSGQRGNQRMCWTKTGTLFITDGRQSSEMLLRNLPVLFQADKGEFKGKPRSGCCVLLLKNRPKNGLWLNEHR